MKRPSITFPSHCHEDPPGCLPFAVMGVTLTVGLAAVGYACLNIYRGLVQWLGA